MAYLSAQSMFLEQKKELKSEISGLKNELQKANNELIKESRKNGDLAGQVSQMEKQLNELKASNNSLSEKISKLLLDEKTGAGQKKSKVSYKKKPEQIDIESQG